MADLDYKTSGAVQTVFGYPFRFYADDGFGLFSVHGAYGSGKTWCSGCWSRTGDHYMSSDLNLVPVKKKKKITLRIQVFKDGSYLAIHPRDMGSYSPPRDMGSYSPPRDMGSYSPPTFAQKMIEVEVEEGEGL